MTSDFNGTMPTLTAGMKARGSDLAIFSSFGAAAIGSLDSYSPTLGNINLGTTGTTVAVYRRLGKAVEFEVVLTFNGTGMSISGAPTVTLPFAPHSRYVNASFIGMPAARAYFSDTGTGNYEGIAAVGSGSTATLFYVSAEAQSISSISAGTPYTVAATDVWRIKGVYEAA